MYNCFYIYGVFALVLAYITSIVTFKLEKNKPGRLSGVKPGFPVGVEEHRSHWGGGASTSDVCKNERIGFC